MNVMSPEFNRIFFVFLFVYSLISPQVVWAARRPRVRSLSFLYADTGKLIKGYRRVRKNKIIKLDKLPTRDIIIRANVVPRKVTQAIIKIDSASDTSRLELSSHDLGTKYKNWSAEKGTFKVLVAPYNSNKDRWGLTYEFTLPVVGEATPIYLPPDQDKPAEPDPDPTYIPIDGETAWTVNNGVTLRDGKAVFPLGVYYVSHYSHTKSKRLKDAEKIAAAGFNMLHTPIDRSDGDLLDRCAELGLSVVMEFNDSPRDLVRIFGRHPALAMLGIFDDVDAYDDGYPRYSPQQVISESDSYHDLLPRKVTYISAGYPKRAPNYVGTSDAMGFQSYPIPAEDLSSVTLGYFGPLSPKIVGRNQAFIGNLQSFGWYGTHRLPTRAEVRNMTYQALIQGIKGLLYYTYYDGTMDMNDHPALWGEMTKVVSELKTLERPLLHGRRQLLDTGTAKVFAAQWSYNGKLLVLVVNSNYSGREVSFDLRDQVSGSPVNLFQGRDSGFTLNSGRVEGHIGSLDVHVYELDL